MKITISIDDVMPGKGYRILGEKTEKWLRELNEEFGAKFTLFVPSNWHDQYPISEHKGWIQELNSIEWIELAAHGHFHQTSNPSRLGECEFAEITNRDLAYTRLDSMFLEWSNALNDVPVGFRFPGWLCSNESNLAMNEQLQSNRWGLTKKRYIAIHKEHNRGLVWKCKTFTGHDDIQSENVSLHNNDMIMYQSHIAGSHNLNVWSFDNFQQLKLSLSHLTQNDIFDEFKTLKECF